MHMHVCHKNRCWYSPSTISEIGPPIIHYHIHQASWPVSSQGCSCLHLPSCRSTWYRCMLSCLTLCEFWGSRLRSLHMCSRFFTHRSIFQALVYIFIKGRNCFAGQVSLELLGSSDPSAWDTCHFAGQGSGYILSNAFSHHLPWPHLHHASTHSMVLPLVLKTVHLVTAIRGLFGIPCPHSVA